MSVVLIWLSRGVGVAWEQR